MNWRRGLFRLWLVASVLWIGTVAWEAYALDYCLNSTIRASDPFVCLDHIAWPLNLADLIPIGPSIAREAVLALGPVVVALALWFAGTWVAGGFTNRSTPHRDTKE